MDASPLRATGRPMRRGASSSGGRGPQCAHIDWRLPFLMVAVVVAIAVWMGWKSMPGGARPTAEALSSSSAMGPLEASTNRQGRDLTISGELAVSAAECALLCGASRRCKAMSYSKGTTGEPGRCWLKESVPAPTPNDLMTSAVKLRAASAP